MTELHILNLEDNRLDGNIPPSISNLTKLKELLINRNSFTGDIPAGVGNLNDLKLFKFESNYFKEIPELANVDSLLYCYNNYLTFEDFERNLDVILDATVDFQYSPQYKFGEEYSITITEENPFTLSIPCGGEYNHYTWFKDNDSIKPAPSDASTLLFPSIQLTDAGTYHITVQNDSVPNLTLTSEPVHLIIKEHCIKNDSLALLALYAATDGEKWTDKENWLEIGKPVNTWHGITADSCSVLKIDLTNNNLTGSIAIGLDLIPEGFEFFKQLNHLFLDSNQLIGEIPAAIGGFSELAELNLSFNEFTGSIPDSIYSLENLQMLRLQESGLSGGISPKIGNLKNLTYLNLAYNQLTGTIPDEIGNLTELTSFHLELNQLDGNIPVEIGQLTELFSVNFSGNKLTGNIPTTVRNLIKLDHLMLSYNSLSGQLPGELGFLTNLTSLHLNNNQFTGSVPPGVYDLKLLRVFHMNNNFISEIPELSNIDSLLYCANNYLTFEDFERNLDLIGKDDNGEFDFQYSPQYKFGRAYDTTVYEGNPFTLSIPTGGIYNHYKWFKNDALLTNVPDAFDLYFSSIALSDTGSYYITVTNFSVPELTLESYPVRLIILNKPTHTSFECDVVDQPLSLTLKWDIVNWADSYALQVSTSPDFSSLLIDTSGIKTTSYLLSDLAYGTTYYWRVNASDSLGTTGWSTVCGFTTLPEIPDAPLLESICDGPEIEDLSLSVSWYSSDRAESYTLQVSTTPDFSTTILNESGITSTSYTIDGLDFKTTYYWRVNASNITGTGEWSTVCYFKTYQPELKFYNLVIIDGQHSPIFMIEGIKYYPENNLAVFTKWGKKIYAKSGYNNELDFSSYHAGTYYYLLDVTIKGVHQQFKKFVDVVKN